MIQVGYGDYTPNTTDEKIFAMRAAVRT